ITLFLFTPAALFPLCALAETFTEGKRVPPTTEKLKIGDFVWEPERAPAGPVLIVVSVPEQVAYVYRNGIRIARTSVSTGRPGHPTPTGVFDILEKEKDHVSTIYKGAEMPWMERLTWTGIAMHAGDLPGYPDSHGCVRLPLEFSKLLYTATASKSDARRSEVSGSKACTSLAPSMARTTRAVRNGFVSMANQRRTIQTLPTWRRNPASTNNLLLECARPSFPAQPSSSPINQ